MGDTPVDNTKATLTANINKWLTHDPDSQPADPDHAYDTTTSVTGTVVALIKRLPDGGLKLPTSTPPGTHAITTTPTDTNPHMLLGTTHTDTPLATFNATTPDASETIPDTPGTYLLIDPQPCHSE